MARPGGAEVHALSRSAVDGWSLIRVRATGAPRTVVFEITHGLQRDTITTSTIEFCSQIAFPWRHYKSRRLLQK